MGDDGFFFFSFFHVCVCVTQREGEREKKKYLIKRELLQNLAQPFDVLCVLTPPKLD